MNNDNKIQFLNSCLVKIAKSYANVNLLTISEDELNDLISNPLKEVPQAYLSLKNYIGPKFNKNHVFISCSVCELAMLC